MSEINRRWIYARKPEGALQPDNFRRDDATRPSIGDGEVLVRIRMVSIEPANRVWMATHATNYKSPLLPGGVMHGFAMGDVVESSAPGIAVGDQVAGLLSWQDYVVAKPEQLMKFDRAIPPEQSLSVFWVTGLAAWYGLTRVAAAKAGETVVISAAAGAVGTIAGQLARSLGCRVIGIAGGREKCDWVVDECGYDTAIDYKSGDLAAQLAVVAPEGVDVFLDNVGGDVLDAVFQQMKLFGRIVICGAVALYNNDGHGRGPDDFAGSVLGKRLRVEGFLVTDYTSDWPHAIRELSALIEQGKLHVPIDLIEGFDRLPAALIGLLAGENRGKRMVRI